MIPAPAQLDSPPGGPRSKTQTRRPRSASSRAVAMPITPAPTISTSAVSGKEQILHQGNGLVRSFDADRHDGVPVAPADEPDAADVKGGVLESLHYRSQRPGLVRQLDEQGVLRDR